MAEGVGYAEPEFGRCLLRPTAEHFQWIAGYILCWLESLLDHRGHAGERG